IICRIWSFATAINKLLFDKNCHICNSYQKGAIFYQSHKVFYTTNNTDYADFFIVSLQDAQDQYERAKEFLEMIKVYIQSCEEV
ncbi:MAG TPA: hypothetical protein H9971_07040, partial [Candidatus Dorea merdavium]|nr:hypothetical protein [Candidatus Dorea merdavium]